MESSGSVGNAPASLRSTYATRLSAGGVADEWVTQLLRQGDAKVFKKYSQMKLQNETRGPAKAESSGKRSRGFGTGRVIPMGFGPVLVQFRRPRTDFELTCAWKLFKINRAVTAGR